MTWNENKKWKEDEIENANDMKTKMKWKRKWNEWMRMGAHKVGRRFPKNYTENSQTPDRPPLAAATGI